MPDYESFFKPFIDPNLKNFSKGPDTQLQWRFEKDLSERFSLGVKATYRSFSADSVTLIWPKDYFPANKLSYCGINIGFQAVNDIVTWQPTNRINGELVGQYHLLSNPNFHLLPQGFVLGSRNLIDKVLAGVKSHFNEDSREDLAWQAWNASDAPKNDNVKEYWASERPPYMPTLEPLSQYFNRTDFSLPDCDIRDIKSRKRVREEKLLTVVSTASVRTSSNLNRCNTCNTPLPSSLISVICHLQSGPIRMAGYRRGRYHEWSRRGAA